MKLPINNALKESSSSSSQQRCDYRKLNLAAFAGTLLYMGYLIGSVEQGTNFFMGGILTSSSSSSSQDLAEESQRLRASASWDRIAAMSSSDESKSLDRGQPPNLVDKEGRQGPVIHEGHKGIPVTSVNLIGERHSGTNWITDHLVDCFGEHIPVEVNYTRFKHWFQFNDPTIRGPPRHLNNHTLSLEDNKPTSSIVIAMFRDPYDWVEAMRERPHHAHDHINLTWKEFVTKPWIGPRGPHDLETIHHAKEARRKLEYEGCLAGYKFDEVVPCSPHDSLEMEGYSSYMYELQHDGSHRAYGSIIDLRREKIRNFLTVADFDGVHAFFPQRYEELTRLGTNSLLRQMEQITGIKAQCTPFEGIGEPHHKQVDEDFVQWMNEYVDWDTEARIGYKPRHL